MTEERWLPIPGYEGGYEISNRGQVRSVPRVITRSDGRPKTIPGGIRKTATRSGWAPFEGLIIKRGGPVSYVHNLARAAFVGEFETTRGFDAAPSGGGARLGDLDAEEWRPIPGDAGYEVSNYGRIRSVDRVVQTQRGFESRRGRLLKPWVNVQTGYLQVTLGRGRRAAVHVVVAAAFIGPRPEGLAVCHNDGVRTNCALDNLRYDTHSNNVRDKRTHGTDHQVNKAACPRGHLLVVPNIVASHLQRGTRKCKACNRARAWLQSHPDGDFRAHADYQFARIMGKAAA